MINTFSFRAECATDAQAFHDLLAKAGVIATVKTQADPSGLPDVEVEMRTVASLARLREILCCIVDGHVMLQTLRQLPLSENSFERDYDLVWNPTAAASVADSMNSAPLPPISHRMVRLDVPFRDKEEVMLLGAVWIQNLKTWACPPDAAPTFQRWIQGSPVEFDAQAD
ncbi:MAG: hypothetical protein ACN6OP_28330 [Pseudomonadales bacterium]